VSQPTAATRLDFIPEGVGVCASKACGYPAFYQRGRVFKSRQYRVWIPGVNTPDDPWKLDPSEFMAKFKVLEFCLERQPRHPIAASNRLA
jgi:hypothetical protein